MSNQGEMLQGNGDSEYSHKVSSGNAQSANANGLNVGNCCAAHAVVYVVLFITPGNRHVTAEEMKLNAIPRRHISAFRLSSVCRALLYISDR